MEPRRRRPLRERRLEAPVAYDAFEGDKLIGMVEGFLEKWNNRFRIANICVFEETNRRSGVGTRLMETILKDAVIRFF